MGTYSLTTTRLPSLDWQENPSQADGEHGSSPFHDLSISCPGFLSDSSSLSCFATSTATRPVRKSPPSRQKHKHQKRRTKGGSRARNQACLVTPITRPPKSTPNRSLQGTSSKTTLYMLSCPEIRTSNHAVNSQRRL